MKWRNLSKNILSHHTEHRSSVPLNSYICGVVHLVPDSDYIIFFICPQNNNLAPHNQAVIFYMQHDVGSKFKQLKVYKVLVLQVWCGWNQADISSAIFRFKCLYRSCKPLFSGGFQGWGVVLCRVLVALRIASHSGSYSRPSDEPGLSGISTIWKTNMFAHTLDPRLWP